MKRLRYFGLLISLTFLFIIWIISTSNADTTYDKINIDDFEEVEILDEGDYWVLELMSNPRNDDIYDIIAESESPVDFIILDNQSLDNFTSGLPFKYNKKYSILDDHEYDMSIPVEEDGESVILLIDNSNKIKDGADGVYDCRVHIWISPIKDLGISIIDLQIILVQNLLIAFLIGGSVFSLGFLIYRKKNRSNLEKLLSSVSGINEQIILNLTESRLQTEKDQLLEKLALSSEFSLENFKKKYYKTQFYLTIIHFEKKGLLLIIIAIIISYIAGFYYSVIEVPHYVGEKEFSNYIIFWSGIGLFIIGILLFIIGCLCLERSWIHFEYFTIPQTRILFLLILYISIQILTIIYSSYVVENLYGPSGGSIFPWIAIIICFIFVIKLLSKIKSAKTSPSPEFLTSHTLYSQNVSEQNEPIRENLNSRKISNQKFVPLEAYSRDSRSYKFCRFCGAKNASSNQFCVKCGKKLRY